MTGCLTLAKRLRHNALNQQVYFFLIFIVPIFIEL